MFTLHYAPDNASLILRLALEEAGLPYRTELVDRRARQQDSAAYRALNPAGLIPTLITPDGPVSETAACLLWLCDRHPDAGLGPAPAEPARGNWLKWLFFLSNTAHADLRQIFYPHLYVPRDATPGHHALMTARMQRHFHLLNDAATAHPGLFALPSALTLYTAALLRWSVLYPGAQPGWMTLAAFPALHRLCLALDARPATQRAAKAEGLGPRPFSQPRLPTPSEGTAL